MKKIIFASLTVLSLGLFSFTPAPVSQAGIWNGSDCGNYIVDPGACSQMSAVDQDRVKSLLSVLYNVPSDQIIDGEPLPAAKGNFLFHKKGVTNQVEEDLATYNNAPALQQGSPAAQVVAIIAQYAQPLPSQPVQ